MPPPYFRRLSRSPSRPNRRTTRLWLARYSRPLVLLCLIVGAVLTIQLALAPLKPFHNPREHRHPVPTRTPTRYRGRVPIVDREKYEEVEARMRYYVDMEGGDPSFEEWSLPPNPYSPPKVTAIPEAPLRSRAVELWPNAKADSLLCPSLSGCRFLLPTWYECMFSQFGKTDSKI